MEDISALYAGGYFLTCPIDKPDYLSDETLPKYILSASACLSGTSGIVEWTGGDLEKLGVPQIQYSEIEEWNKVAFGSVFGYPDVFYTLSGAQRYVQKFIPEPPDDLVIIGIALSPKLTGEFLRTERRDQKCGVYETLERREKLSEGSSILGYEVIHYEYTLDHSWLCYNDLHQDALKLNIEVNLRGFLTSFEDANKVIEKAYEHGLIDGVWLPWLIVQYPIASL